MFGFKIILCLFFIGNVFAAKPIAKKIDYKTLSLEERKLIPKTDLLKGIESFEIPEKIAFWADFYIGTPYDTLPIGKYVEDLSIDEDDVFDCMSLTFRVLELTFAKTKEEALANATYFRFPGEGKLNSENPAKMLTYDGRFEYGEDMILSKKYGRIVTGKIAPERLIPAGSHLGGEIKAISMKEAAENLSDFISGDIVFFVKNPSKRVVGETIGHIGFIKREGGKVYLIHASGSKNTEGGKVTKVLLTDYAKTSPFIGMIVTRFYED